MQCTHIPEYVRDIRAKYVKLHSDVRETVSDNQNIENQTSTSSDQLQVYANLEKKDTW